jgi:hypothetical protein
VSILFRAGPGDRSRAMRAGPGRDEGMGWAGMTDCNAKGESGGRVRAELLTRPRFLKMKGIY